MFSKWLVVLCSGKDLTHLSGRGFSHTWLTPLCLLTLVYLSLLYFQLQRFAFSFWVLCFLSFDYLQLMIAVLVFNCGIFSGILLTFGFLGFDNYLLFDPNLVPSIFFYTVLGILLSGF